MSFVLSKLIKEPDYVPYCGSCSPVRRLQRHSSGDYNVCTRCGHESYLNGWRKWPGDLFWDGRGRIPTPRYWILNDGKDSTFSHANSILASVRLDTDRGYKRFSIIILPELKARG